jgi:hypothetical protein
LKLTLDSSEPLEDAMRVFGALYGVTLVVADMEPGAGQPSQPMETVEPAEAVEPDEQSEPDEPKKPRRRRRSATGRRSRSGSAAPEADSEDATSRSNGSPSNAEVRSWARENGLTVNDRGRVPASVLSAYREANGA